MKFEMIPIFCLASLMIVASCDRRPVPAVAVEHASELAPVKPASVPGCLSATEIVDTLQKISAIPSQTEARQAEQILRHESRKSSLCRQELIAVVIIAMNQPKSAFRSNAEWFNFWRAAAQLLGEVQATEALDFLIAHLDVSSGIFSTTMSHQPALRAVISIGEDAIPKLEVVLRDNPDPNMRNYAVYCISAIGGPSALRALKQALPSESDRCINQFIRVCINELDNKEYRLNDNVRWFSAFICHE